MSDQDEGMEISRTVAETILDQLSMWGVKRIYGVIGDAIFGLLDAIAKQKEIQFISVKH
jgi:pyruvate dehydrogenase (quinone)/pyruvate oxidase